MEEVKQDALFYACEKLSMEEICPEGNDPCCSCHKDNKDCISCWREHFQHQSGISDGGGVVKEIGDYVGDLHNAGNGNSIETAPLFSFIANKLQQAGIEVE